MIGQTIGSYRIVAKLGEGGMGAVYLGEHQHIARKAAIKVLLQNVQEGYISEMILSATPCMAAPMSPQIENRRPLLPKWPTRSLTRTGGSAKLPSDAVHEWAITGHGQDAAPHDVSAVLGALQVTV